MRQRAGKWWGVDLDGTLAEHQSMPVWDGSIGPPIPVMVERVKRWLAEGKDIRILTARVAYTDFGSPGPDPRHPLNQYSLIDDWCVRYLGRSLSVTCSKDYDMEYLFDDRAIRVEHNTGRICAPGACIGHPYEDEPA